MRIMIGKRIGPVPISLVAVLALAAFISAGLWLVPNGNQTAEAQGFANDPSDVCYPVENTDTAGINLDADADIEVAVPVAEQCVAFGDSVTMRIRAVAGGNTYQVFTNGKITGGADHKLYLFNTATDTEDDTAPSTTISFMEVEVPDTGDFGSADHVDFVINRNGNNPVTVQLLDLDDATNTNLDIGDDDFEITDPTAVLNETIYFVTTDLGRPVGKPVSTLMVGEPDHDEGESGPITATFKDNELVATFAGYKTVADAATDDTAGEVSFTSPSLTVQPRTVHSEMWAALIPGMDVTVESSVRTRTYAVVGTTVTLTDDTTEKSTLKGTIATGPGAGPTDIVVGLDADSIPAEMNSIGVPDSDTSTEGTAAGERVTTSTGSI